MKLIKLIFISACIVISMQIIAQEADATEAYYTYELKPTDKVKNDTDTLYQVIILIDTTDLDRYIKLIVETSKQKNELKIAKEDRKENIRIKVKKKNYFLDMGEWLLDEELVVQAQKTDGSMVKLCKHPRASEFYHEVQTTDSSPGDLKFLDDPVTTDEKEKN